ncbi:hypothetical protein BY996DRAFT_6431359 [Phakopsora pachyrhizi]|nr:hypothetical protein BY996DRAFT_6431359 [Phakopsora pachyrhizi]
MITGLHLTSIYIFTRGFLLNRTILTDQTFHDQISYLVEPTHRRAIVILIDALRHDFILPPSNLTITPKDGFLISLPGRLSSESPLNSRLYHLVADPPTTTLQRLKAITTGTLPTFIDLGSNFDSTQSTIQEDSWIHQLYNSKRVIGFAGDDTWINLFGLRSSNLSTGLLDNELSLGFESFNVEDLDTVDRGVEDHLFKILGIDQQPDQNGSSRQPYKKQWDVLIGHLLGLDHAGHRFGASHPTISSKLDQYDRLLERLVSNLDDDTLLVVLGDHGMDSKGDHGGDSFLEVSTALWLYSKTRTLSDLRVDELPDWILDNQRDYLISPPDSTSVLRSRTVSQIDLVPTLSLLLGLPIPFSNLGMIIPELFYRSSLTVGSTPSEQHGQVSSSNHRKPPKVLDPTETLLLSTETNSLQLLRFLETYAGGPDSPGSNDFSNHIGVLRSSYKSAHQLYRDNQYAQSFKIHRSFGTSLLSISRKIWASFAPGLMFVGIMILILSLISSLKVLDRLRSTTFGPQAPIRSLIDSGLRKGLIGTFSGLLIFGLKIFGYMNLLQHALSGTAFGICFGLITHTDRSFPAEGTLRLFNPGQIFRLLPLLLHALALGSNSYTVWENQVVVYLISATVLIPVMIRSFSAPQKRLRNRLIMFSALFGICVRLISLSKICREEQYRWCSVTFYADSTSSTAPSWVVSLLIPVAICLPIGLAWFLGISDSYRGAASIYFGTGLRLALLCGVQYWISDFIISQGDLSLKPSLKFTGAWVKTLVARIDIAICLVGLVGLWYILPLCIDVEREEEADKGKMEEMSNVSKKPKVYVIGFANAYGSSYLMYLSAGFGLIFLVNQPMGELTISIGLIAILSLVEIHDSLNDARSIDRSFQAAVEAVAAGKPLPGDSLRAKTGTDGEEAERKKDPIFDRSGRHTDFLTISGLGLLSYVLFFGTGHQATLPSIQWKTGFIGISTAHQLWSALMIGFVLVSLSVPLLGAWNLSPILGRGGRVSLTTEVLEGSIKLMNYHAVLGLSSMLSCSILRRHLMVWKIFAPRFMMASLVIVVVDLVICFLSSKLM